MSEIPPAGSPEPTPPGNTPGTPTPAPATTAGDPADVEKNKVMAILAYIGLLVLVPILAAKDSPFAKYHANQGLVLTLGGIGLFVVLGILFFILGLIAGRIPGVSFVAGCFSCLLFPALSIGWLVFSIMGILNAVNGQMKPLPLIPPITLIK